MATADLSAVLRQGLPAVASHPILGMKNVGRMIKMAGSEKYFRAEMEGIQARPTYNLMLAGKVSFTDLGEITSREELRAASWLEKIPGLGRSFEGRTAPTRAS